VTEGARGADSVVIVIVLVSVQVSNERSAIRNGITIRQILIIGPNAVGFVRGQQRERDRGVHTATVAGDHRAVNHLAGTCCVLDHLQCAPRGVSVRFLFSALASSMPRCPSRFGRVGTVFAPMT